MNRSDAALLSLLPYGVGQKAALAMYFSSTRNGNRAVKTLVERGLLEEHQLQTAQGSSQNYLMLTLAGLEHLEQKYNYYYPWLTDAVELLREEDTVSFVRGLSSGTVRSLLTAHGCNVAFNVANIDTFMIGSSMRRSVPSQRCLSIITQQMQKRQHFAPFSRLSTVR